MAKFGKYLKRNSLSDYTYINYKMLKQILNEIYVKLKMCYIKSQDDMQFEWLVKEISLDQYEIRSEFKESEGTPSDNTINRRKLFPEYFANLKKTLLRKFTQQLDKEIAQFYFSFLEKEKSMYITMNHHLHQKQQYDDYSIVDFVREIEELYCLGILADSMNKYVIINLQCIKKILKKFDKKMKEFFIHTSISVQYIRSKLKIFNKDSDIMYILKFKLIDEIATLIESLNIELNNRMSTLRPEKMYQEKDMKIIDPSDSNQLKADLLNDSANNCYTFEYTRKFNVFYQGIESTLVLLNSNSLFRVNPLELVDRIPKKDYSNVSSSSQFVTSLKEDTDRNVIHIKDNEFCNIIELFVPKDAYKALIKDHSKLLSAKNNSNKNVLLFHSFIYSFLYALIIAGLPLFFQIKNSMSLKIKNPVFAAIAIITLHFGMFVSKIVSVSCFIDKQYYLYALILSVFSGTLAVSLFFYFFEFSKSNIYFIYPILFLFGYSINEQLSSSYLKKYIPKLSYGNVILFEKVLKLSGFVLGILLIATYNVSIPASIILLVISSFFFSDPKSSSFSQMNMQLALQSNIRDHFFDNLKDKEQEQEKSNLFSRQGYNDINISSNSKSINDEEIKLNKVNETLGIINKDSKYNDSNEIPQNLKAIMKTIQSSHSGLFGYISFHILANNFINYSSLFLLVYYFIDNDFNKNKLWLPFLFLIPYSANCIVDFILFPLMQYLKLQRQRNAIITFQIIIIFLAVFFALSIYEPGLVPQKKLYENSIWKIIFFILMTIHNYLIEYVEKDYFITECTITPSRFCKEERVFEIFSDLGKLIGVIVSGLIKIFLPASPSDSFDLGSYLNSFICIHLVIDIILLLIFLGVLIMKIPFIHKLVHRLMKEEKFYYFTN